MVTTIVLYGLQHTFAYIISLARHVHIAFLWKLPYSLAFYFTAQPIRLLAFANRLPHAVVCSGVTKTGVPGLEFWSTIC